VSLILPHINYGYVVFSTFDSVSQRRLNVAFNSCLRYVHDVARREHVSHLVPTIIGVSLATHLRIHHLTFLFKVLHIRHPCYLSFRFFGTAHTRSLIVTHHRSLAMGHSFTMGACGLWNSLPHRIKNECILSALWDWIFYLGFTELLILIAYFCCVFALIFGDVGMDQP
jgi:hypothetical protein